MNKYHQIAFAALSLVWAALIYGLSSIPSTSLPQGPSVISIIVHFVEFAVLAYLIYRAFAPLEEYIHPMAVSVMCSGMYALFDEVHQIFVPGRVFSGGDILVDFIGILSTVFIVWLFDHNKKTASV